MELAELRVFLAVAAERSFSRAAAKLHRTQPAVSQAIRRLEEEVGERLFDRSSKDGTLTEAGRVLRDYAERLRLKVDDFYLGHGRHGGYGRKCEFACNSGFPRDHHAFLRERIAQQIHK